MDIAPFRGFLLEDFDFFATPVTERTSLQQAAVKARLSTFFDALLGGLGRDDRAALGEVTVGQLPLDAQSTWARTHAGTAGVNLTVELWANDLQVDLVAWRVPQAERFRAWLASDAGSDTLSRLSDYEVVLFARRARKGPSGNPWWQRETFREVTRVPATSADAVLAAVDLSEAGLNPRWEKLAFHLRRAWQRASVLAARESILEEARPRLVELTPIVDEVNGTLSGD